MNVPDRPNIIVSPDAGPPELVAAVGAAAVAAYTDLAGPSFLTEETFNWGMSGPDMVWRSNLCYQVSDRIVALLTGSYKAMTEYHPGWDIPGGARLFFHAIALLADEHPPFIIDGTWQRMAQWQNSFAEPGTQPVELPPDAPLVLAGTRRTVVARAVGYGITDSRILNLWARRGTAEPPETPKSYPAL